MDQHELFCQSIRVHLDPIWHLMEDDTVSEIMINRFDEVYIERDGLLERAEERFTGEAELISAIKNIAQFVGKRISAEMPRRPSR